MAVEVLKTIYWDAADARFMVIVKGVGIDRVRHHKVPRDVIDKADAETYAEHLGLGFHHESKQGWGKPFKATVPH